MVQVARLAPGYWTWLPKVRPQKMPVREQARQPVARAGRRAPLFPGDLARTLPVRAMPVPGILVGERRIQTQRLQSIEQARDEAWQPVVEQAAQLAQCEQELFLRRRPFEEKLTFARELRRGQRQSGLNRRSRSCRHRSEPWRRQTRKPGW